MKKGEYKYGLLFAGFNVSEEEKFRVGKEIEKLGSLTFQIHKSDEGWFAQCNEVSGIIAGNANPNPTDAEIQAEIRQAIFSAFNVEVDVPDSAITSPYTFEYSDNPAQHNVGAKNC